VVARQFEAPPSPWDAGHRGVDLVTSPGAAVLAPADGVVTFAGFVVDRGVLVVAHAGGLRTSYEPVDATVSPGERVVAGQQMATVGPQPGHCSPGTCLHWGLRRGTTYLDPLRMVRRAGPPVLLPPNVSQSHLQETAASLVRSCRTALVCI
jgi:murein DD-endopeptidase MepM/ murein hydrolase activator NlpD